MNHIFNNEIRRGLLASGRVDYLASVLPTLLLCCFFLVFRAPSKTLPDLLLTGVLCGPSKRHLVCSKQDISCVPRKTFRVFQAGHLVCSKQDILCVPSRTSPVFQARHFLCSKQNILLCSKQNIFCVSGKTFLVFRSKHSLRSDI